MKKYALPAYPSFSVMGKLHTAVGPLSTGKVLRLRDSSTTGTGDVCNWEVALATSATDMAGVLGYLVGPLNGNGTSADGDLVQILIAGQVMQTTGAGAAGNQVYVSNTGLLANAAGDNSRKVGQIFASGGGKFDCWFSGWAEAYGPPGISDYSVVLGDLKPPAATPTLGVIVKVPHIDHVHPSAPLVDGEAWGDSGANRWDVFANRLWAKQDIRREQVETLVGDTALLATQHVLLLDATGGSFTVTLPDPTKGMWYTFKRVDATPNLVTLVTAFGVALIDGAASYIFRNQWEGLELIADDTDWFCIGSKDSATGFKAVADLATNDATLHEIWSHTFPELELQALNVQVLAQTADNVDHAEFTRSVRLARLAGSPPTITQNAVTVPDTNTTDWAISIDINGNTLRVRVAGHAAVNVAWRIYIDGVQLG